MDHTNSVENRTNLHLDDSLSDNLFNSADLPSSEKVILAQTTTETNEMAGSSSHIDDHTQNADIAEDGDSNLFDEKFGINHRFFIVNETLS